LKTVCGGPFMRVRHSLKRIIGCNGRAIAT
jgi:hypothetical protein